MVFGLVGLLFNLVTLPGILTNRAVQRRVNSYYGVPTTLLAVEEDADWDGASAPPSDKTRAITPADEPGENETVEALRNYVGVEAYRDLFKIVLAPLAVLTAIGAVVAGLTGVALVLDLAQTDNLALNLVAWLGLSVLAHAFPNSRPTDALWEQSRRTDSLLRLVGYPVAALAKLFDLLEFLWIDAIYAFAVWASVWLLIGVPV